MKVKKFTFNPFQENTYVLYDDSKEAVIIDPGCYDKSEENELVKFIDNEGLRPVQLLNTHAHIDHVFGNEFVSKKFNLKLSLHPKDHQTLTQALMASKTYGLNYTPSPMPEIDLKEGDKIQFGQTKLDIIFVPGHAPGHVVFLNKDLNVLIGGDVLFRGSIGRTDLPGGNHEDLLKNIEEKLFVLNPSTQVYSGHGPETTIGYEKAHNPFF